MPDVPKEDDITKAYDILLKDERAVSVLALLIDLAREGDVKSILDTRWTKLEDRSFAEAIIARDYGAIESTINAFNFGSFI